MDIHEILLSVRMIRTNSLKQNAEFILFYCNIELNFPVLNYHTWNTKFHDQVN
jgi:hypothetical protein